VKLVMSVVFRIVNLLVLDIYYVDF